jgi:hypothetical protein
MTNLQHAIQARGLDELREIRNLKRRLHHQLDPHGHYYWANSRQLSPANRALLQNAAINNDVRVYCHTWSRLNHLVGEMS